MEPTNTKPESEAMRRAIKEAGGLKALADALGEQPNTVSNWINRGAPIDKCPSIEHITGVLCEELRPEYDWAMFRKVLCAKGRGKAGGGSGGKSKEAKARGQAI
ncbi:helix-turn-helix domain-containing protein [Paraburkholderia panacisoli]|uniref:Helix-turn-helix domain-containing protein n=1 Tax=Paraburkholderia panacisoli TaxID=2603818 RepID=A0A5B0HCW7_9BURK|nr:YdaS family helix-turn-helix protein [Paraburkholderia panacisoli]KAA1012991.1 helix-turn-helix domain-containing protein [Paraburkholderia panacisoli]